MPDRIIENINSTRADALEPDQGGATLARLCSETIKRRGRRGRPKGSGREHPERSTPKTFRNFSPLAQTLLLELRWTDAELREMTEAEIVEEALIRMAKSLSNRHPNLSKRLERAGR